MKRTTTLFSLLISLLLIIVSCKPPVGTGTTYPITKGNITGNGNFSISPSPAEEGATITLTVTAGTLLSWSLSNGTQPARVGTSAAWTFTMPNYAVTVGATFTNDTVPFDADIVIYSDGDMYAEAQVWEANQGQYADFAAEVSGYNNHTKAVQLGPQMGLYGGGLAFYIDEGIDFSSIDALTFMAKSPDDFKIATVGFGGADLLWDDTYLIEYAGETNNGITIGAEWQQYVIPIPSRQNVLLEQVFELWAGPENSGKTLYLDDIGFISADVSLESVTLVQPVLPKNGQTLIANLRSSMKATYNIVSGSVNKTVSLFEGRIEFETYHSVDYDAGGAATISASGIHLETGDSGPYTFAVLLDGVRGEVSGTISATAFLLIENCVGTGLLGGEASQHVEAPDANGYYRIGWNSGFETIAEKNCIVIRNRKWDGDRPWDLDAYAGRNLPEPIDLAPFNKITFPYYAEPHNDPQQPNYQIRVRFRLKKGEVHYTSVAEVSATAFNVWQDKEITLTNTSFREGETGTTGSFLTDFSGITGWEIATQYTGALGNWPPDALVYFGAIVAYE